MKKILAFIMAVVLVLSLVACGNGGDDNANKGVELLAEKTPKELYAAAIDYIKSLTNYEIVIDSKYTTTVEGQTDTDSVHTLYKSTGDSFYYLYQTETYEEYFIHDGTTLYRNVKNIAEKSDMPYDEFIKELGSVTESGILVELKEENFAEKLFIPDGEKYYLEFSISKEQYAEITELSIETPVDYKVYFDKDGNILSFERSMDYYYSDAVLVKDEMNVCIQNVGTVEKISAPQNADEFAVRLKMEDLGLASIGNLNGFESSDEATNYVLLDIKIDGEVKVGKSETVTDYKGQILIKLFPEVAPLTVSNFQKLVGKSFYDGLTIHQVITDFIIQGGDPKGDGTGGSGEKIFGEFTSNGFTNNLSHKRGIVSMAHSSDDPDSASSQFFICQAPVMSLDGNYAAFGCVIYGIEVVDVIAELETDGNKPKQKVTIEKATFLKEKK